LPPEKRDRFLNNWIERSFINYAAIRLLTMPLKALHFDDPEIFKTLGCIYKPEPTVDERPRYLDKVASLPECDDETIEVDAVVVGTGAGGAPVAHGLAKAGHAVLMLEEGRYFTRKDFQGTRVENTRKTYRYMGTLTTFGNALIPIPQGKTVGGSTTINSGTCYRTPEWVLEKWRKETGLSFLNEESLAPYFEDVETALRVEAAKPRFLTGVEKMIAKGCDSLGYRHGPLRRNAPDCDGQGFCCYGCPTDAKRSTNVSYVPMALNQGAFLYTGARVEEILVEEGRAVGVVARAEREDGSVAKLVVRARAIILSCGTLLTPMLLMKNGLLKNSPALGRNLVIHPAMQMLAMFGEELRGWNGIPQGYAIEEFHRAGILFEGAFTPLEVASLGIPFHGEKFMEIMEGFNRLATFGFFVADRGGGSIRPGPMGRPIVHYNLHKDDIARVKLGASVLWRVFKEAGATEIFSNIHGHEELTSQEAHDRMMRSRVRGRDLEMTAFHPLSTARLGSDPKTSVVDENHESHELPGLFIVDGSSVPASPSVNPQVTIMALALRAAERIAHQLN
jgi:hypothetical protein